MKKLIVALLIVTLCVAMVCPALAAESFVPSITYKPMPELSGPEDDIGMRVGKLKVDGEILAEIYLLPDGRLVVIGDEVHPNGVDPDHECLVITPYSEVATSGKIPEKSKTLIQWVYEQILALGMSFFEGIEGLDEVITAALGEGKTVHDLVVKDLFDVSVLCEELETWLEPVGNTVCLDFDLDLAPGAFATAVTYKHDKWNLIEDVEVLEDGSVFCKTFEHFCPVAILVANEQLAETGAVADTAVNTGDMSNMGLWIAVAGVSLLAVLACFVGLRKTKKAQ